jgi:putative nucleotidyltransferase with HDIG domain
MSSVALAEPQARVLEAVKKVSSIATLPEVTAKIIATVEDPKSTASTLHKIVSHDPALVTRIMKVVNSAFYGLPGQIGSIERAIVLLGLNAIKNIAVAASLGQLFKGAKLCDGFTAKDLWTHCIAVGVAARELARQMKLPVADEAFLAGMIHDVGILISLQSFPEQLRRVCDAAKHSDRSFIELEREHMNGMDHQQLGMCLAEQWRFPKNCQLVAGYHHNPAALGEQSKMLVMLVHVADTICCQSKYGFNLTAMHQSLDELELKRMHIDPAIVQRTASNLDNLMTVAATLLT